MLINKKKILLIIFLGFLLSVFQIYNHLNKYDKNLINSNGQNYHQMIKADPLRYMSHGSEIKEQLKTEKIFLRLAKNILQNIYLQE